MKTKIDSKYLYIILFNEESMKLINPKSASIPGIDHPGEVDFVSIQTLNYSFSKYSKFKLGTWMLGIVLGLCVVYIAYINSSNNINFSENTNISKASSSYANSPHSAQIIEPKNFLRTGAKDNLFVKSFFESVEILNQRIIFSNPQGYCTIGKTIREIELMNLTKRAIGDGARLVHAAVLCSELDDYKSGRRDLIDHWLQIQLIGPKGNFKRIEMDRESFLQRISKTTPKLNSNEINYNLKRALNDENIDFSNMQISPIGRDGNAQYFSIRSNIKIGDLSRKVNGISAVTLLNSLPIAINVYEVSDAIHGLFGLQQVQKELLMSLFSEN